jgi:DDE superfamily endonuclease
MPESYHDIEDRIQTVIASIPHDRKPKLKQLARIHHVPYQRLLARFNGRQSRSERAGPHPRLDNEQDMILCIWLDKLDAIGASANIQMLLDSAFSILKLFNTNPKSPPAPLGPHWSTRWIAAHPQYFKRRSKPLELERALTHEPRAIADWYMRLLDVVTTYDIQDCDFYNFDETGFRIGIARGEWIITRHPKRRAYIASPQERELVTCVETISADGYDIPPMIIIAAKLHMESWYKNELPDDVLLAVSETGYSNDELSLQWIQHFNKFTTPRAAAGAYRLLIFDGYGGHCTFQFIQYCDQHRIIPFCLPPHTSHLLQPLDVVVFQPYKHHHAKAVNYAIRTGCTDFNRLEFLAALPAIRKETFKPATIISAFKKTGLVPWDPKIVMDKVREAIRDEDDIAGQLKALNRPLTPPSNASYQPIRPTTPHSLVMASTHLRNALSTSTIDSPTRKHILSFIKGSVLVAGVGHEAEQELYKVQALSQARLERRKATRTSLQKGGVLYAKDARQMVTVREQDKEEAARRVIQQGQERRQRQYHSYFKYTVAQEIRQVRRAFIRASKVGFFDIQSMLLDLQQYRAILATNAEARAASQSSTVVDG